MNYVAFIFSTFSAFWLRSSVVSVLNCVNAVTASIGGSNHSHKFFMGDIGICAAFPDVAVAIGLHQPFERLALLGFN